MCTFIIYLVNMHETKTTQKNTINVNPISHCENFCRCFLTDGTKVLKCSFSIFVQERKVKFAVFGSELTYKDGNEIPGNTYCIFCARRDIMGYAYTCVHVFKETLKKKKKKKKRPTIVFIE